MTGKAWNQVELHTLMTLWPQGYSASEIAEHIPSKSREAICGKLFRLRADGEATSIPKRLAHAKRTRTSLKRVQTAKANAVRRRTRA